MAVDSSAPQGGTRSVANPLSGGVAPWSSFVSQAKEHVPELRWPRATATYERMLTDSQVWGLFAGTVLPIEDYAWWIDPNGNDEAKVALLAEDLGLPVGPPSEDGPAEYVSLPGEFDFGEMLHEALLAPVFGHYYFEWAGSIRDGRWRLDEMSPMHPATITDVRVDRKGNLEWVKQQGAAMITTSGVYDAPKIKPESLIPFVYWPDAQRKWIGRSLLRSIYRNWLCKDVLIRLDVTNHERAGGVPVVRTDDRYQGTSLDDLQRLAAEFRQDEEAGAAMPPGAWLELISAGQGDRIASINYHDQQMAKAWQGMVRELGQTATGSRALGGSFQDLEALARRAMAGWAAKTLDRWCLARWWFWNYGGRTPPVLRFTPPEIEASSVPVESPPAAVPPAGPDPPQVAATGRPSPQPRGGTVAAAETTPLTDVGEMTAGRHRLPERDLRRQAYPHEVQAAVDFEAVEAAYDDGLDSLDKLFRDDILPEHLAGIRDAIENTAAGEPRTRITADAMAKIKVPVVGADAIADRMLTSAISGAMQAHAELAAQGVDLALPDEAAVRALVVDHAKAVATMLANGVQIAASGRAVALSNTGATAAELADEVVGYVDALKHDWEVQRLQGAVQHAVTAGRHVVWDEVEETVLFYGSALLDDRVCGPCSDDDGREFDSLEEAQAVYPAGNASCEGGPRCRCVLVAVLADETPFNSSTVT